MNKAFEIVLNLYKDAEINNARDFARNFIANFIFADNFLLIFFLRIFLREDKFFPLEVRK